MSDKQIDLTRMWDMTNGMYTVPGFVFLRVTTPDMPGSFLTRDVWFVTNKRLPSGEWSVMLNSDALKRVVGPHSNAAAAISRKASLIAPLDSGAPVKWVPLTTVRQGTQVTGSSSAKPSDKFTGGPA